MRHPAGAKKRARRAEKDRRVGSISASSTIKAMKNIARGDYDEAGWKVAREIPGKEATTELASDTSGSVRDTEGTENSQVDSD